jgi:thioredoxin reductase
MYDLIIIGGGPAGLTAAIYALRKRLDVLLITQDLGGKTNYRLQLPDLEHHLVINGEEIVNRFANEIEYLEFAHVLDKVELVEQLPDGYRVLTGQGGQYRTRALIVASGANARRLNVPGEKEFMMRGLCYSAVSYAPLFIDRTTAVVGDTGLAFRSALELAQIAKEVTLILPTSSALDSPLGRRLQATMNVVLLEGYRVERVEGDEYARRLVVRRGAEVRQVHADAFFVEFDLLPNSKMVAGLVECDANGRIMIDAHNRTSAPGIFAAGDVTNAYAEQVLIAIGEGAKAALSAYEYLLECPVKWPVEESLEVGEWR